MSIEGELAQSQFLQSGGIYARILMKKQKSGELARDYSYSEYPKMLRIFKGTEEVERSTEIGNGSTQRRWLEKREIFDEIIVRSEDEEDRVLAGGKTAPQLEDERQDLIRRCRMKHIQVDPSWKTARLRRELGDMDDVPKVNQMEVLQEELSQLRAMSEMRAEIERLRAEINGAPRGDNPDQASLLRRQLADLGVRVDGRWSVARMQEELERASVAAE